MSDLSYLEALLLGALQGLTEFLPISSSGHLVLAQRHFDIDPGSPAMLLFDVLVHVGTLVAAGIVFAGPFAKFCAQLVTESKPGWTGEKNARRILLLAIAAVVPTAVIGLGLRDRFEEAFSQPHIVGLGLMGTGVLLLATRFVRPPKRGWREFNSWRAVIVGIAQGAAILPGVSRSGSTICIAIFLGLRRRWAGEFSFLIVVPAIIGGAALQIRTVLGMDGGQLTNIEWGPMLAGTLIAALVGVGCLKLLLHVIRRAQLHWFALYCFSVGALVLLGVV